MKRDRRFTENEVRAIAVAAEADPRTVKKALVGKAVRGLVGDRVRKAIDAAMEPIGAKQ